MGQVRNMPNRKKIAYYWQNKYDIDFSSDVCWACGFEIMLDRCHLLPKCLGGSDDADNLVLLCRFCHNIQEVHWTSNAKRIDEFKERIIDGPFFMAMRFDYLTALLKHNLVDCNKEIL